METPHLALAGLLHDIGKFSHRAKGSDKASIQQTLGKNDTVDKLGQHAIWSADFIQTMVPAHLQEALFEAVLRHHHPSGDINAMRIALADRFSADKALTVKEEDGAKKRQLPSIFNHPTNSNSVLPLKRLEQDEACLFPIEPKTDEVAKQDYLQLWKAFENEAKALAHITDVTTYLESVQALMMRYTWSVPSPDETTSLYNHSRVVAMLTAAMATLPDETIASLYKNPNQDVAVASLITADLSGIQKFIYTISAKQAAKQLRGRSLYLQILTDAIAYFVLNRLNLPPTNLLYSGGGRFYIVASADCDLTQLQQEIDDKLLTHHDGEIYAALGKVVVKATDFHSATFGEVWKSAGTNSNQQKRQRFRSLPNLHARLFDPTPVTAKNELGKRVLDRAQADDNDGGQSELKRSFIKFSTMLPRAQYLALIHGDPLDQPAGSFQATLQAFGMSAMLLDESGEDLSREFLPKQQPDTLHYVSLLGMETAPSLTIRQYVEATFNLPTSAGLRFTMNVIAKNERGDPYDFSDLVGASKGLQRLGVLRMDVDNLGQLFQKGLNDDHKSTLANTANLSFSMSLYFEGWVAQLCRRINDKYQDKAVYGVYSGGDDLFIVGRWDVMPKLAQWIHDDLSRYATSNPRVHISAGITLHGDKYPLYQAAEEAEDALDQAKKADGKNSLCFMDEVLPWSHIESVKAYRDEMIALHDMGVPRALPRTIIELHEEYKASCKKHKAVWGPWIWHNAYLMSRLAQRHESAKKRIQALQLAMTEDNYTGIERVALAARWADALIRPSKDS